MLKKITPKCTETSLPKIAVDLPPLIEAFCRYYCNTQPDEAYIKPTLGDPVGTAIYGFSERGSLKLVDETKYINPVYFCIPVTMSNWYSLETKHWFMRADDTLAFIKRIESLFSGWVEVTFRDGYAMNLSQLDIIECICDLLNVRMNATNFDHIKKYDYRKHKKKVRLRTKTMLMQRISEI